MRERQGSSKNAESDQTASICGNTRQNARFRGANVILLALLGGYFTTMGGEGSDFRDELPTILRWERQ